MYLVLGLEHHRSGINQSAEFASGFFLTYTIVQFAVVLILTPAYTAGAIADEKDRRTIEFILATDLRNREIILGKLLSRLANLMLLLLTGLPILAFLQFMGGIDPNLLLACFAATVITVFSVAALSIATSVASRNARDAIARTFLVIIGYFIISGVSWLLLGPPGWASWPSTATWQSPVTLNDIVHWLNAGNIISAYVGILEQVRLSKNLATVLPSCLLQYGLFHIPLALLLIAYSIARLRAVALKQRVVKGSSARRLSWRPRVGDRPMLWKELFGQPAERFNIWRGLALFLIIAASFFPVVLVFIEVFGLPWVRTGPWGGSRDQTELVGAMSVWVKTVGCILACFMLLGIAVRASISFSGERDRQTLDSILATPMESVHILRAKWLGSIFAAPWAWLWLVIIYILAVSTQALHPMGALLLLTACFIYGGVFALRGLWFSMVCRTTPRATVCALLVGVAVSVGHWLVWMCCIPFSMVGPGPGFSDFFEVFVRLQAGITPPVTFVYSFAFPLVQPYGYGYYGSRAGSEEVKAIGYAGFGLLCWSVAAFYLWHACLRRFNEVTCRVWFPSRVPIGKRLNRSAPERS
jgi:ABC-type transport system involved in multi-copper enzyme maturation permease subunit